MDLKLIIAIILTFLPFIELRGGLPLAVYYSIEQGIPVYLTSTLIILLNILLIFLIFFFLDYLHIHFLKIKYYKKFFELYLKVIRKKISKFNRRYESIGFLALVIFVAIPLPGTGAFSGSLLSWILGLDRKKSIVSISIGVIIAGILVSLISLGIIS